MAFEVSGSVSVEDFTLQPGFNSTRQHIAVRIPAGKKLVLVNTKFCFDDTKNRFLITAQRQYRSKSNCSEERPRQALFTNTSKSSTLVKIFFQIENSSRTQASTVFSTDGWWARFNIV
ncbi:hypothetical protein LJK88_25500 [Paenibacillus sp. P26]|nr:hypothetical protein LJK88_25500 [Paenibacillus sp. P26]UUZ95227.1 hypothetical protein LJK87_12475 [Paenibacillus sp. P25]